MREKDTKGFCCSDCSNLVREYIGDGFDEFYDWKCGAKDNKPITCMDTFDPDPVIPEWCPKLAATLKEQKEKREAKKSKKEIKT